MLKILLLIASFRFLAFISSFPGRFSKNLNSRYFCTNLPSIFVHNFCYKIPPDRCNQKAQIFTDRSALACLPKAGRAYRWFKVVDIVPCPDRVSNAGQRLDRGLRVAGNVVVTPSPGLHFRSAMQRGGLIGAINEAPYLLNPGRKGHSLGMFYLAAILDRRGLIDRTRDLRHGDGNLREWETWHRHSVFSLASQCKVALSSLVLHKLATGHITNGISGWYKESQAPSLSGRPRLRRAAPPSSCLRGAPGPRSALTGV